jgi:formamidopyrimidine-DNA glycosylase
VLSRTAVTTDVVSSGGLRGGGSSATEAASALIAHLGMSGQLLVQPPEAPDELHLRIRFRFADDGPELRFVDQRTFGGLAVCPVGQDGVPSEIAHIALDPLDVSFDVEVFGAALCRRRTGLKRALLDQSLISGVGNIYADEALWRAKLHYARPTETLRRSEVERVVEAVRAVMTSALAEGGTSFDRLYVNVNGESGYFERSLRVYGREGLPCHRCGTVIATSAAGAAILDRAWRSVS